VSDHTFIDILKIDIEGGEFDALTAFVNSHAQGDLPIGQLQIEIHAREGHERFDRFARWWASLEEAGLRPFLDGAEHGVRQRGAPRTTRVGRVNVF